MVGRAELVNAFNSWVEQNPGKKVSIEDIEHNLMVKDTGDVDLTYSNRRRSSSEQFFTLANRLC